MRVRLTQSGFTLLEIAIVLMIIGLLIGVVTVGSELILAARIRATLAQLDKFNSAASTFQLKYNYLPGDFPTATTAFAGCTDNGGNGCNGNGNGIIGEDTYGYYGESCRFWEHLARAGLLQSQPLVYVNQNAGYCDPSEIPQATYNAAASWHLGRCFPAPYDIPGCNVGINYFLLAQGGAWDREMTGTTGALVSPTSAHAFDVKIDDGNPMTGNVLAGNVMPGLASAPYAIQNRNCLYSANQYASPVDYGSWSYYTSYTADVNGCKVAFKTNF